ncbi:hypothetical protein ACTXT7_016348 [Hymenolepis weldensis]
MINKAEIDNHREIFQSDKGATSNDEAGLYHLWSLSSVTRNLTAEIEGKNEAEVLPEEESQCIPLSLPRIVNSSNDDFSYFSPILMPSTPVGHPRSNPVSQEQKYPFQLNSTPAFHQQNGRSMDETRVTEKHLPYYTRREDHNGSPQTISSLQGGSSNPHTTTTSSSSSLLPSGRDLQQSSCASSSNNVFHAVPPLLPSLSANADNRQWNREDPASSLCNEEVRIRQRQRTSSVASRQCWQDNEAIS